MPKNLGISMAENSCGYRIQFVLALITTTGFFGSLFYLLTFGYPTDAKDQINMLLGGMGTIWTLQMNYFFGSSSSSKAKEDTIAAIATATTPATNNSVASTTTTTSTSTTTPVAPAAEPPAPQQIVIPGAESVTVKTESGDVNLTPKENTNEKPA